MPNTLIIGYGGIGSAVAAQCSERGDDVFVVSRQLDIDVPHTTLDISQEKSIDELVSIIKEHQPDTIINTAGMLHTENQMPEKSLTELTRMHLANAMTANVMPMVNLGKALTKALTRDSAVKVIALSARVSSISDNQLGGWYSYRMSKAALNMLIKNISLEWKRQFPKCAIYGYHPGTVDTRLSKPFQQRVPQEKLFSQEQAAKYLLKTLASLAQEDSGELFDWQGVQIKF